MRHSTLLAVSLLCAAFVTQAQAGPLLFHTILSGAAEAPANASPGTGTVLITVDDLAKTMRIQTSFSGLLGTVTAAHIHCCTALPNTGTAGVATQTPTFPGFPSGVTGGVYDSTFNMLAASSYNASFLNNAVNLGSTATAFQTLITGFYGGNTYFNIHTNQFPGGEIRGFITAVPEPATLTLMGLGMLGLGLAKVRRSKR